MKKTNKKTSRIFDFNLNILIDKEDTLCLKIEGELVPASRPRVTRFGSYIAEPYKSFKVQFSKLIRDNLLHIGSKFINSPLSIDITYYKSVPKSYSKEKIKEALKYGCVKRPDLDNYYKAVLDSMDNIIYNDDSYVVELTGRKLYTMDKSYLLINIKKFVNNNVDKYRIVN